MLRPTASSFCFVTILLGLLASAPARAQPFTEEGAWGMTGSEPGELTFPRGLAWSDGVIFVAEQSNARISRFDEAGTFLGQWGSRGTAAGEFDLPTAIAVDSAGNVYTTEVWLADRVQKFTSSGSWITAWGGLGGAAGEFDSPASIAIRNDVVYVADAGNDRVQEFALDGTFSQQWTYEVGGLSSPDLIAVAPSGEIWIGEVVYNRIHRFDAAHQYIETVVTGGSGPGFVDTLIDMKFDSIGNLYVAEQTPKRIQKFAPDGTYLAQHLFDGGVCPHALTLNGSGLVYVADSCNDQVIVLRDGAVGIFSDGFETGDTSKWM